MKFEDIPTFPYCHYTVSVRLYRVKAHLESWDCPNSPLIMNPDWQRGHIWTPSQQISYVEYFLKGGTTGRDVYFNCSSWMTGFDTPVYCVDGLQRITAILAFFHNQIPVFGKHYFEDFEDSPKMIANELRFNMMNIKNKRELLKVYLDFNSGGTPHNPDELECVARVIELTGKNETL